MFTDRFRTRCSCFTPVQSCRFISCSFLYQAEVDALHVAIAVVNGIDYLLTWNCKHLANALLRNKIETVSRNFGYEPPVICTPEELMEE